MEPTFATRYFYVPAAVAVGRHTCAVCGLPTAGGEPTGRVLRPTFTDHALLRRPATGLVCPACVSYFGRQELRRASWWLTPAGGQPIERRDLRKLLAEHLGAPPDEPGYLLITTSKRKHLALRAPLNLAGSAVRRVQFELATLELDAVRWSALTAACDALRRHHTWQEILSDAYQAWRLAKWAEPGDFVVAREVARPYLRTAYLELVKFCGDPAAPETEEGTKGTDDTD